MDMENVTFPNLELGWSETTKKFKILAIDNIHILLLQHCLQSYIYYITNERHAKSALQVPQQAVLKWNLISGIPLQWRDIS